MKIDILTLFPEMFEGVLRSSILGKAEEKGLVSFHITDFRDFSGNKHGTVDDYPYGGGGGMVLKPDPIFRAVEHLHEKGFSSPRVILMCPQGDMFSQKKAEILSKEEHLIFICGHYEGYDERIRQHLVTDEISIGDYVLTGGELPALVVIDSVCRLIPGVLGNETSALTDSFQHGLLEYPHYTRPFNFRGWEVPEVLISGNHGLVDKWRKKESLRRTLHRRPDLLQKADLDPETARLLEEVINEGQKY